MAVIIAVIMSLLITVSYVIPTKWKETTEEVVFVIFPFIYLFVSIWILLAMTFFFPFTIFALIVVFSYERRRSEIRNKAIKAKMELIASRPKLSSIDKTQFHWTGKKQKVSSIPIHCFQCGSKLEAGDKFCPTCGDSTEEESQSANNSS